MALMKGVECSAFSGSLSSRPLLAASPKAHRNDPPPRIAGERL